MFGKLFVSAILLALFGLLNVHGLQTNFRLEPYTQLDFAQTGGAETIEWSPDGNLFAVGGGFGLWLYDNNFELLQHFDSLGTVRSISWSPDNHHIAMMVNNDSLHFGLLILDIETQEIITTNSSDISTPIVYSPDGRLIAFGSLPRTFTVVDAQTGESVFLHTPEVKDYETNLGMSYPRFLCWLPDSSGFYAVFYWNTYIYDLENSAAETTNRIMVTSDTGNCNSNASSTVTSAGRFYDAEANEIFYLGENIRSLSVSWNAQGDYFAMNSENYWIQIWTSENLALVAEVPGATGEYEPLIFYYSDSLAWHPASTFIAAVAPADNIVRIWRIIKE